jgi:hypothetical protein
VDFTPVTAEIIIGGDSNGLMTKKKRKELIRKFFRFLDSPPLKVTFEE